MRVERNHMPPLADDETNPFDDLDVLSALGGVKLKPYSKFADAYDDLLVARVENENGGSLNCSALDDEAELATIDEQRREQIVQSLATLSERVVVEMLLDLAETGPVSGRGRLREVFSGTLDEVKSCTSEASGIIKRY